MKKTILTLIAVVAIALTSCEKSNVEPEVPFKKLNVKVTVLAPQSHMSNVIYFQKRLFIERIEVKSSVTTLLHNGVRHTSFAHNQWISTDTHNTFSVTNLTPNVEYIIIIEKDDNMDGEVDSNEELKLTANNDGEIRFKVSFKLNIKDKLIM
jgi:hypothetical protein